jgi:hypothetical protein
MKKEIKQIILSETDPVNKLIQIYKLIDKNIKPLSKALGVDTMFIQAEYNVDVEPIEKRKSEPSVFTQFRDVFLKCYDDIKGVKYHLLVKDIGQLKNCVKYFKDVERFKKICDMIQERSKRMSTGKLLQNNWKFIIENLSPGIMINKINFLFEQETKFIKKKEWNWEDNK